VQRDIDLEATLVAKYVVMGPLLNARTRRLWAAAIDGDWLRGRRDRLVGHGAGPPDDPERASKLAQGVTATDRIRRLGAGRPDIEPSPG
jgi:hypothetical protein